MSEIKTAKRQFPPIKTSRNIKKDQRNFLEATAAAAASVYNAFNSAELIFLWQQHAS